MRDFMGKADLIGCSASPRHMNFRRLSIAMIYCVGLAIITNLAPLNG